MDVEFPEGHPERIVTQTQLAQVLLEAGETREAVALFDEALSAFPDDVTWRIEDRMRITSARAAASVQLLEWEGAAALLQGLLDQTGGSIAPDHPEVLGARMMLAAVLLETDEPKRALAELQLIAEYGEDERVHPINRGAYWGNLAEAQVRTGEVTAGLESLQRSQALYQGAVAADSTWMFSSLLAAGRIFAFAAKPKQAESHYERALDIASKTDVDPGDLADARMGLARLIANRDSSRARTLASAARDHYAAAGDAGGEKLAEVEAWLRDAP